MTAAIRDQLASWPLTAAWAAMVLISLGLILRDLKVRNPEISGLMRVVWLLTVLYSGPLGLALYWWSGRKQIPHDSLWRRGGRSVAHCYSGCGAGEIVGLLITVGLLAWIDWRVSLVTFLLAYLFGYGLTVGPLLQEGVALRTALWDAFTSETASITVMEVVAILVDRWLSAQAVFEHAIFWNSLVVSLSCGLLAAWPVNVMLIHFGVKSGMHDPREMAAPEHAHNH